MGSTLKVTGDGISHLALNCLECEVETLATTNRKRGQSQLTDRKRGVEHDQWATLKRLSYKSNQSS